MRDARAPGLVSAPGSEEARARVYVLPSLVEAGPWRVRVGGTLLTLTRMVSVAVLPDVAQARAHRPPQ